MDAFLQMDIFFIVTTIVVIVIGALIALVLFYVVRLLRTLERIARDVEGEAKAIISDIDDVRAKARIEGFKVGNLLSLVTKAGRRLITNLR
ncbi:MAG TPA: hypothetical protein VEA92_03185 [Candidatus Paceibacterota bacterium]|nr:hypothetical protein [Candidatus Paceibacterota bacterium]